MTDQTLPSIAIIVGTTRQGRNGSAVGEWVAKQASARSDANFELLEVADFDLGLLDESTVPGAANKQYENPKTTEWSKKIDGFDGYVFVTTEYNHSVPASMKNAFDLIAPEWYDKAVAFVGYGADGAVRAVEHWRQIVANAHLVAVRASLALSLFADFSNGEFKPGERRADELGVVFDQLVSRTALLKTTRV